MIDGLVTALREAASERSCRTIVLTGAGQRAFCAGIDIKLDTQDSGEFLSRSSAGLDPTMAHYEHLQWSLGRIIRTIHALPIPVIAAVNGHAVGAGFAMTLASDFRIASQSATFANGFVRRGISGCELGVSYFLPRLVGASIAFDWMVTGRQVGTDEALRTGLICQISSGHSLLGDALELGDAIAANAPMAVTMTKEVMWSNMHAGSLDQALALEARSQTMTRQTADAAEARRAFLEKRAPVFDSGSSTRPLRD
jgi:enoyl-CoA hydratase